MEPHPPQLPTDDAGTPAASNWKRGPLLLLLGLASLAILLAYLMPKKQVEGQNAPAPTEHRATSPGYSNPTH